MEILHCSQVRVLIQMRLVSIRNSVWSSRRQSLLESQRVGGYDLMTMPDRRARSTSHADLATAIALFGLVLHAAALLGLMALVLPQLLGILVVILIFAVPAAFHYLVWGWWLSQMQDEDAEANEGEDRG